MKGRAQLVVFSFTYLYIKTQSSLNCEDEILVLIFWVINLSIFPSWSIRFIVLGFVAQKRRSAVWNMPGQSLHGLFFVCVIVYVTTSPPQTCFWWLMWVLSHIALLQMSPLLRPPTNKFSCSPNTSLFSNVSFIFQIKFSERLAKDNILFWIPPPAYVEIPLLVTVRIYVLARHSARMVTLRRHSVKEMDGRGSCRKNFKWVSSG